VKIETLFFRLTHYLKFLTKASGRHSIHSPFVFALYEFLLNNRIDSKKQQAIENIRKQYTQSKEYILMHDFGVKEAMQVKRSMRNLAVVSSCTPKLGSFYYSLVTYLKPKNILELGTCIGMASAYMASALPESTLYTIEGDSTIASLAEKNFKALNLINTRQFIGDFDSVLNEVLQTLPKLDLVLIDGNHRKQQTLKYFVEIIPFLNVDSLIIFDDINYSKEMYEAWSEIKKHPQLVQSVELYRIGLAFFNSKRAKEHFCLAWPNRYNTHYFETYNYAHTKNDS
jgi:predicted O-methyltransferase YrrM